MTETRTFFLTRKDFWFPSSKRMFMFIQATIKKGILVDTHARAYAGFGAWGEGGERLNTHDLFCSLSRCLSFSLHPPPPPHGGGVRGDGVGAGTDCVCVCVCVVCLKTSSRLCLFDYFCDIIRDLIPLVCVCVCVRLPPCGLPCSCVCPSVRACAHMCMRACVLLCGCLSLVSIFISRKCCRCWRPSTASCRPTPSSTRAPWLSRRRATERRSLASRCFGFPPRPPPALHFHPHPFTYFTAFFLLSSHSSLQHAAELVKTVASRYDEYVSVKDLNERINRALTAAKKDNNLIYNDRVPEIKELEHIGKAALVKAAPITPPLSQKFTGETHHKHKYITLIYKLRSRTRTSSASWHPVEVFSSV